MKNLKKYLIAVAAVLSSALAFSQIAVVAETDATLLANSLIGAESGVTIVSATYTGTDLASGTFSGGDFGIAEGILLTTGTVNIAEGPNTLGGAGSSNGAPGDADLNAIISPFTTHNAAILEITFIPDGNSLEFTYVFGSEEYNEYVCSNYNDAFAFIVNGGAYTNQNIALIPGTTPPMPVAINNVNNGTVGNNGSSTNCTDDQLSNTAFYIDNFGGENIEYDGYTVPLAAVMAVEPGVEYTIKLVIADAGDAILDSGVFLEGQSFVSVTCDAGDVGFAGSDDESKEYCKNILPSTINVSNDGQGSNDQYLYILTNANDSILSSNTSGSFITEWWTPETYSIYGMSYSGNLIGFGGGAGIDDVAADGCYEMDGPIVVIVDDCEGEYDCPELEANIGAPCELEVGMGILSADCECMGIEIPDCSDFVYYLSDHDSNDGSGDIYGITLSGNTATMAHIASSDIEVHIAYNETQKLIYAISKNENSYRTLNPTDGSWGSEVLFDDDYGQITTAVFNHDGKLLIGSQTHKAIYSVNVITNEVSSYDTYAPINGGDLAFGSDGMLYLATRSSNGLFKVWTQPTPDDLIGFLPPNVTGMAITDADQLLISAKDNTSLVLRNTNGTDPVRSFDLILDGEPYTLRAGDMASGCNPAPPEIGYCEDFTTFLANHGAGIDGSDIYTVDFTAAGLANLSFLTNVEYETHIAFDAKSDILYMVNVDGSFVRSYNVGGTSFIGDVPIIGDFNKLTAAVFNPIDSLLYVGDHIQNKIFTIDPADGTSAYFADAPVSGGDLEILDDGTVYLATKDGSRLYEIVGSGPAILVGGMVPNVTGMARANDESDSFITSNNGATVFSKIDANDASTIDTYPIMLDGVPFTLSDGDMAAGCNPSLPDKGYCNDFTTFLANHGAGISGSDIYTVDIDTDAGEANMTLLTNVDFETHIAFNAKSNILYLVNVDGSSFASYDISTSDAGDIPIIGDFIKLTAAVFNPIDSLLYVGDHVKNEIHTIDPQTGTSAYFADAPVSGGDLEVLNDGTIYLGTKDGSALYKIVASGPAVLVGTMEPNVTGMARANDDNDSFITSNNGATELTKIAAIDGSTLEAYAIMLDGVPFALTDGDMAAGCADSTPSDQPGPPGTCYASEMMEYVQGTAFGGGAIATNRTDPNQALGEPERVDELVFVSLGYGGSLILGFNGPIPNGPGDDIQIVETSYGNPSCEAYPEYADVSVSVDGVVWHFAKTVCRTDGFVDISDAGEFDYVNFVKIENNDEMTTTQDAFDVDGVVALHNCIDNGDVPPAGSLISAESSSTLTSYPNPTTGPSKVVFTTGETARTLVEVYDMNGRNVATLFNQEAQKGEEYMIDFDGNKLPNGVYIYRMTTQHETIVEKFMIAR